MKRVDIYFVIYLSAIVSFFALEGELRTKKTTTGQNTITSRIL